MDFCCGFGRLNLGNGKAGRLTAAGEVGHEVVAACWIVCLLSVGENRPEKAGRMVAVSYRRKLS